jgi:DNA-binding CsgD family transcriptional regulator
VPRPIGREDLLSLVSVRLALGRGALLYGPAGIGKSTLLTAFAATEEASGVTVLRASVAEAEADLPYLALVDLFDGAPAPAFDALARHLRAALDGALLRGDPPTTPHDQLAVRLAVLEVLRALSADRPVLVVLDDVQWVDQPSAGVLRFVARRLDGTAVRVLAAERVGDAGPVMRDLCPEPRTEILVPPLSEPGIADLLRDRFGKQLSLRDSQRVFAASGGNPLYAVELGRALRDRPAPVTPTDPLPVPGRLRGLLAARLAALPPAELAVLLLVAAAARPSGSLLARCGVTVCEDLPAAVAGGVILTESDGVIRFAHPLLREMVYADASDDARRKAHLRLAEVVADPVEIARHLATARSEPDQVLASSLARAAAAARLRAAPAAAADLARLAAERTPEHEADDAAARWLEAARYASEAGALAEARSNATTALRRAIRPRTRVGARLLLVELAGEDQSGAGPLLDAAFTEVGDSLDLLAHVRLRRAVKAYYDGDVETAHAELKLAEEAAERCEDPERLVEVLSWRGSMLVGAEGDDQLERAGELARSLPLTAAVISARQLAAMARLFRGDVAAALRRIAALRVEVEQSGAVRDLAAVLISVAGVYGRAGRCSDALLAGRACVRLYTDVMPVPGPGLLVGATTELNGGSLTRAARYADRALQACLAAGDEDWIKIAHVTRGMVLALRGDHVAAVAAFRSAHALERRLSRVDPGQVLWHADFVEELVSAGAREEASIVLSEVTACADRFDRWVADLGLARARAYLTAADGRVKAATQTLAAAIERWADHPYPLEVAHAYFALGCLERRAHRRGAARAALAEAIARYGAAQAIPWRDAAARDLARLDGGRGARLSETEQRIVDLVRSGATNREIGRAMFLSVKAVEANLTRLYRRLNVSNRAQLAQIVDESD